MLQRSFALVAICALFAAVGLSLRASGESKRLFWSDEAVTALRAAGHTQAEFLNAVQGQTVTAARMMEFAGREKQHPPIRSTVISLASEDAKHPPLYYLITAIWTRLAGASIPAVRLPALVFGLLVPFAIAWMCFELFGNRTAALLGLGLSAVSPILVIYSEQAKEYSLWALLFAAATAIVLRAARTGDSRWWIAYGAVAVAGMYTDELFGITLAAHAVYAIFCIRGANLRRFVAAAAIAVAAFVPWMLIVVRHRADLADSLSWSAGAWPFIWYLKAWTFEAGSTFFDLQYEHGRTALLLLPIGLLTAAAIYWATARTTAATRVMTGALLAAPALALLLPDLLFHDHRSTVPRYGMPLWITLIVCVAGFLAHEIRKREGMQQKAWIGGAALLMAVSAVSTLAGQRAPAWWDNDFNGWVVADARAVDSAGDALVVVPRSSNRAADALNFAFYLKPDVRVELLPQNAAAIPKGFTNVYLLGYQQDALELSDAVGCCMRQVPVALPRARPDAMLLWTRGS